MSSLAEREPGVAVGPGDEALVAWASSASPPAVSTIRAMRVPLADGILADLGGGCSGGGNADASCAHVPGSFGLRTRGAAPLAPAALLFGVAAASASCGPCTLVTNPIVTVPMLTDGAGTAQLALQLDDPGLVGGALVVQWVVAGNGGCASVLSLSNGLGVQIQ